MEKEYCSILKTLSQLHIVPYYRWNNAAKGLIGSLLEDIPFFITKSGNIFIGESSQEKIKNGRICLQAHLDHPGGNLYFSENKDYMYMRFYGQKNSKFLVGRKFGTFLPGRYEKISSLEVEHCYENGKDDITMFFKADDNLLNLYKSGQLIVHFDSELEINNGVLKNWNLDDLLNAAAIIYLFKYEEFKGKYYGLLTINEEVGNSGLFEFLNIIYDKQLYFICMDVVNYEIKTTYDFGIRTKQDNVELDRFIPDNLKNWIDKAYLNEIPIGRCEGVTLIEENRQSISMFIKIKNFHNGIPFKKFVPEKIQISTVQEYLKFIKDVVKRLNSCIDFKTETLIPKADDKLLNINIEDHSEYMKDIILSCDDYADYLTKGLPKLRDIFLKYNMRIPNINSDNYYKYKELLNNKERIVIDKDEVEEIGEFLISKVERIFRISRSALLNGCCNIEIVQIIMGNFNACNYFSSKRILMFSCDRIQSSDLLKLITHELTHYITFNIWRGLNAPRELKTYYDEGLAIYLTAKKLDIELYESLGLKEQDYYRYIKMKDKMAKWFEDYCKGNCLKLFKGKFHQYFVKNDIPHPFYANQGDVPRYGYFLSAYETKKLIEEGFYYDKLLC